MPPHLQLGARAHRSSALEHFDEDMIGLDNRDVDDAERLNTEELEQLAEIALLVDHPGYQKMRAARLKTIENYRSGNYLKAALLDPEIDNAKLGELVRNGLLLADELEKELLTVESAHNAIEEDKAVKRARRNTGVK